MPATIALRFAGMALPAAFARVQYICLQPVERRFELHVQLWTSTQAYLDKEDPIRERTYAVTTASVYQTFWSPTALGAAQGSLATQQDAALMQIPDLAGATLVPEPT